MISHSGDNFGPFSGGFTQFCLELRGFYRLGGLGKRIPAKEVVWPEPKVKFHPVDLEAAPVLAQTHGSGRKAPQNYRQIVSMIIRTKVWVDPEFGSPKSARARLREQKLQKHGVSTSDSPWNH